MTKDTKNGNAEQSEWRLTPEELIRRGERELIRETIEVENRELLSEYEANGIASVLAGLKFDDVAKAETVVPDPSSTVVATFRTFDGLVVEITGFASNGKHFVTFNASVDGARADLAANAAQLNAVADYDRAKKNDATAANPTDAAAKATAEALPVPAALADPVAFVAERRKAVDDEAARLTALTKAWVYVLPAYKYANMDKRLEDLLKPKA